MAEKAPIFDYSAARDSAASPASQNRARAVGGSPAGDFTALDAAGIPAGKSRPPARRTSQARPVSAGPSRQSSLKSVAMSLEEPDASEAALAAAKDPRVSSDRPSVKQAASRKAKSPSQKRSEKKRAAKGAGDTARGAAEVRGDAENPVAVGKGVRGKASSKKGKASKDARSQKRRTLRKPKSAGDLASLITNGILDLASAAVEFVKKPHSKAFYRGLVAALAVVVALMFIYPSVRDYYVALRNNAKSEAEYAALQEYYDQLKDEVETLNSDQGVEDAARDEFGMVMPGDVSLNVKDLESEADFDKDPTDIGITPAGSVEAPEEWYTPFCDFIFGYDG
ncbi:MAG: septum formation initiator family protein [Eggerthellaceae bacterium]